MERSLIQIIMDIDFCMLWKHTDVEDFAALDDLQEELIRDGSVIFADEGIGYAEDFLTSPAF